ncbi:MULTISPECIES: TIGR02444 family protein [unclassified Modicisalibacter]|uniref:TIGR02444 family protein n=1 Tax=unclassified Modicisalibacter TaxID=2679913 RepID=UPI001CCD7F60|nr:MULTISPECIES: TIGR02444 family protein [unclassified Modicisalibacter]MBZ9558842.1 TIGR02444 family protein [Modicisalibacter sp. R2A 31.J]MBZ9575266.1 TIGR02444 family protein [Modicisalibacter sp. MOD 31.J]
MAAHSTRSPFALTAPDALWRYACGRYADPDVAAACLALQDRADADVCELLWLGWLYHLGLAADADVGEALAPVRDHQARTTRPLRARRRALKPLARPGSPLAEWREQLKRDELQAEREALEGLQALTRRGDGIRRRGPADGDLYTTLLRHLGHLDPRLTCPLRALAQGLATTKPAGREPHGE